MYFFCTLRLCRSTYRLTAEFMDPSKDPKEDDLKL